MDYMKINSDYIIDWCVKNGEVAWLKATAAKKFPTEDGKERSISFVELKLAFVEKFMPEIAPQKKEKKPSMFDRIAAL